MPSQQFSSYILKYYTMRILLVFTFLVEGMTPIQGAEEKDPLMKEKLDNMMAKSSPGFISLDDFMGFMDKNQLTRLEEDEFLRIGSDNISFVRITVKVIREPVYNFIIIKIFFNNLDST